MEPDPTYSDALYYAVECQDYVYNAGVPDGDARLAAFLETGRVLGVDRMRLGSVYYGDLPCIYWPNDPPADPRPAPIIDAPYQTIILGATGDPITPPANVTRLANRLTRVHTFITTGGPHITFGWGEACPDEAMGRYLLEGKLPEGSGDGLSRRLRRRVRRGGGRRSPRTTRTPLRSPRRWTTRSSARTTTATGSRTSR